MFSVPLTISAITVLLTYVVAAWQDWRTRTVYRVTWYPAAILCLVSTTLFWKDALPTPGASFILILSILLAACFAIFALLKLYGLADAKALILLSLAVPVTPFAEWIFPSLAISTIINAGVFSLTIPAGCLIYNLAKKNRAPFWLMCSGRPVPGAAVKDSFGFLAEEIQEIDGCGSVSRRFLKISEAVFSLKRTKSEAEIKLCEQQEVVWMTIGIPLLVPLTGGLILAMFGISILDWVFATLY